MLDCRLILLGVLIGLWGVFISVTALLFRLEAGESLEENTQNVIKLAEKFLSRFFASLDE